MLKLYFPDIFVIIILMIFVVSCDNSQNDISNTSPPVDNADTMLDMSNNDLTPNALIDNASLGMNGMVNIAGMEKSTALELVLDDLDKQRFTEKGLFQITIQSEKMPLPINQIQSWKLHLQNASGEAIENAEITVAGGMPLHNHGMPTVPQVSQAMGNGNYLVEGIQFQMPGQWLVTLNISVGEMMDSVSYNLMLQP